jgi:hypothetical protein
MSNTGGSFGSDCISTNDSEDLWKDMMPDQTGTSFISVDESRDIEGAKSDTYVEISNSTTGTRGLLSCVFGACAGGQSNHGQSPTYELNTPPTSPFGCIARELESGWPEANGRPIDLTAITEESRSCDMDLTGSNSANGASVDTAIFSTDGKFDTYGTGRPDEDVLLASTSIVTESSSYSALESAAKSNLSDLKQARAPEKTVPKKKGFFCCKRDVEDQVVR